MDDAKAESVPLLVQSPFSIHGPRITILTFAVNRLVRPSRPRNPFAKLVDYWGQSGEMIIYKTVWGKDEPVCTWAPSGRNIRGETPVRDIKAHGGADLVSPQDV